VLGEYSSTSSFQCGFKHVFDFASACRMLAMLTTRIGGVMTLLNSGYWLPPVAPFSTLGPMGCLSG
jgi:hypothetical protein